ncbi:TPA: transposase [Klebsiella pneumoniae]|uniref:transposase n=1 Tax=Klebsiella TaxID=570 RepID=UPI001084340A|nr:transposase [Klebsiella quasipneumoniae]HBR1664032.1 transposase [Klebsiella pneumoniae]HCT5785155.1 transposase [Klebsiella variicola]
MHTATYHLDNQNSIESGGWIGSGERIPVKITGSLTRMNIIVVLCLNNIARTVTGYYPLINARNVCEFFIAIRQIYLVRHKVYLITDRAPYHQASLVQDWSVVMNEHTRNNQYFSTSKDFLQVINGFFSDILPEIAGKRDSHINDIF